jgi:hypothetical protein
VSRNPRTFRPGELSGSDANLSDADLAAAYAAARELETALPPENLPVSPGFADRVMAALAGEPTPRAAGFLAGLLAHPGPATLLASVREAWSIAARGAGRPTLARGLALAYVLAIVVIGVSLTGAATYGTAGALGLLGGDRTPEPSAAEPFTTPTPSESAEPSESIEPWGSPEPSESVEPSESPGSSESAEPSHSADPSRSPEPSRPGATDDHSGSATPGPSASDDGFGTATPSPSPSEDSGSGSGSPTISPKPSEAAH